MCAEALDELVAQVSHEQRVVPAGEANAVCDRQGAQTVNRHLPASDELRLRNCDSFHEPEMMVEAPDI